MAPAEQFQPISHRVHRNGHCNSSSTYSQLPKEKMELTGGGGGGGEGGGEGRAGEQKQNRNKKREGKEEDLGNVSHLSGTSNLDVGKKMSKKRSAALLLCLFFSLFLFPSCISAGCFREGGKGRGEGKKNKTNEERLFLYFFLSFFLDFFLSLSLSLFLSFDPIGTNLDMFFFVVVVVVVVLFLSLLHPSCCVSFGAASL